LENSSRSSNSWDQTHHKKSEKPKKKRFLFVLQKIQTEPFKDSAMRERERERERERFINH
jgi:hypothetical protein